MPPGIRPRVIHYYVSPLQRKLLKLLYLIQYRNISNTITSTSNIKKKNKILYKLAKTLMNIIDPDEAKDMLYYMGLDVDVLDVMGDNEAYLVLAQKLLLLQYTGAIPCSDEPHQ